MRKKILIGLAVVVAVAVVAIVVVAANLGKVVRVGVEKGGTAALGVQIALDSAQVSVLGGKVGLDGLSIGSPAGFREPAMFTLDHAHTVVQLGSLRSDEIVVEEVVIDGPQITLEFSGVSTNWGTLLKELQKGAEPEAEAQPEAAGKTVRIDRITLTNGTVRVAGIPVAGSATVPLPTLEITGLGAKKAERRSVRQVGADTVTALYAAVVGAVGDIVPAEQLKMLAGEAGELLKGAGAAARQAAGLAVGAAGDAAAAVGGAAKAAGGTAADAAGAAADAVGAAAGAAGDAAGAVGGAAKETAGKAAGLVRGVFGGDEE